MLAQALPLTELKCLVLSDPEKPAINVNTTLQISLKTQTVSPTDRMLRN
jgi:hypothetical protein